jgi:hypothetical protein
MTSRLAPLLTTLDFSEAELCALILDGVLFRVGEGFSAVDEVPGVELRARSLSAWLPPQLVAERGTAAWVWGARNDPPVVHELCVDISMRARPVGALRLTVREVVIGADEVARFDDGAAPVTVTTPVRTAVDIARTSKQFSAGDAECVAMLMVIGQFDAQECVTAMERRRNLPGKKRAVDRLRHSERIATTLPRVTEPLAADPLAVPPHVAYGA